MRYRCVCVSLCVCVYKWVKPQGNLIVVAPAPSPSVAAQASEMKYFGSYPWSFPACYKTLSKILNLLQNFHL